MKRRQFIGALSGAAAVSAGVRHPGMEHWLPLFYDSMATVFDYVDGPVLIGLQSDDAISARTGIPGVGDIACLPAGPTYKHVMGRHCIMGVFF